MPGVAKQEWRRWLRPFVTFLAVLLAVATPVAISVMLAHNLATESEATLLRSYSHNLSHRAMDTTDQIVGIIRQLRAVPGKDKCSTPHLAVMRSADLVASNVQAIGYIADNKLLCASISLDQPYPVGPVDFVGVSGWKIRLNQTFAFAPNVRFIMLESDGWVAIVNKALLLDTPVWESGVITAVVNPLKGQIYAARGVVKPSWLERFKRDPKAIRSMFLADGYIVAVSRADRYEVIGVAAAPIAQLDAATRKALLVMVPIGFLIGLALGFGTLFLLRRQQSLRVQLRNAIRHNELSVVYQPAVDLKSRRWIGAEALLRWRRRDGIDIPPDVFIPLAESSGLINEVTDKLLSIVASECAEIFVCAPQFRVALNVSGTDIQGGKLRPKFREMCKTIGISPKNLIMEVTERTLLDERNSKAIIHAIRDDGVQISIDDFGTGYSSLAYLESFEIDYLKIDKSFTRTIGSKTQTTEVLSHVISLAKALHIRMVAEGVETEAEAIYLLDHEVEYAQGWLFARAMTREELLAGLRLQAGND